MINNTFINCIQKTTSVQKSFCMLSIVKRTIGLREFFVVVATTLVVEIITVSWLQFFSVNEILVKIQI